MDKLAAELFVSEAQEEEDDRYADKPQEYGKPGRAVEIVD